ncbi:unnamed protein product, partial [Meganyctiphanes norvegica]
ANTVMAKLASRSVHVFTVIPTLATRLQEALPNVKVVNVDHGDNLTARYLKKVNEEDVAALQEAEVLLGDSHLLQQIKPEHLSKMRWVQSTWVGMEHFIESFRDKDPPPYPITRMGGDNLTTMMGEYVTGRIILHERDWLTVHNNQMNGVWDWSGKSNAFRTLADLTVGILGVGSIGKTVAHNLSVFGSRIHGLVRSQPTPESASPCIQKHWLTHELPLLLGECDYLVNLMPSTPSTRGMLGGNVLSACKKCPVLINLGRGDIINEADIVGALDAGWLSAAHLDVFDVEPLPQDSLLWKHPKVFITPHAGTWSRAQEVVPFFCQNYERFINGQQLINEVDFKRGYLNAYMKTKCNYP